MGCSYWQRDVRVGAGHGGTTHVCIVQTRATWRQYAGLRREASLHGRRKPRCVFTPIHGATTRCHPLANPRGVDAGFRKGHANAGLTPPSLSILPLPPCPCPSSHSPRSDLIVRVSYSVDRWWTAGHDGLVQRMGLDPRGSTRPNGSGLPLNDCLTTLGDAGATQGPQGERGS